MRGCVRCNGFARLRECPERPARDQLVSSERRWTSKNSARMPERVVANRVRTERRVPGGAYSRELPPMIEIHPLAGRDQRHSNRCPPTFAAIARIDSRSFSVSVEKSLAPRPRQDVARRRRAGRIGPAVPYDLQERGDCFLGVLAGESVRDRSRGDGRRGCRLRPSGRGGRGHAPSLRFRITLVPLERRLRP
jgi:hypothetical protein